MKFAIRVTDAAILDQIEAACWYDGQRDGLGRAFEAEVLSLSQRLESDALRHSVRFADVRRAGLRRFKSYGLFYIVRETDVTIFAILHSARNPVWVRRRRGRIA